MKLHFDHDAQSFNDVLLLSELDAARVDCILAFEIFSSAIRQADLQMNEDMEAEDMPNEVSSKSCILERCLKYMRNDQETALLLMTFTLRNEVLKQLYGKYFSLKLLMSNEISNHPMADKHPELLSALRTTMLNIQKEKFGEFDTVISLIEAANYDFNIFMSLLDIEDELSRYKKLGEIHFPFIKDDDDDDRDHPLRRLLGRDDD
jgi:hypothetical protein